jgi:hypothetical protein
MLLSQLSKSFLFLVIIGCLLSTFVHAKIEKEEAGEERLKAETPDEGANKFDELFKDEEIAALLQNPDFDIEKLLEIMKKKGIDFPSAPDNVEEGSSLPHHHEHAGHSHEEEPQETSYEPSEKSEI